MVKVAADGAGGFEVATQTERLASRRLVLVTGIRDQFPEVEVLRALRGKPVQLPPCGCEAKGQPVVATGWSEQVAGFALELLGWAGQVTAVTQGAGSRDRRHRRLLRDHGVAVREEAVRRAGRSPRRPAGRAG